jgi:hypothetical protein
MTEKTNVYQNGMNRKDAANKLLELIKNNGNKPIVIKSKDGEEAYLSKTSVGKLVSETAAQKSIANGFTKEQHFAAASNIYNLFKNSTKVLTLPDKSGDPNVKAIHRFAAPTFGDNGVFITVKEATEQGKRIYSIELIEMGKLEGKVNEVKSKSLASIPATNFPSYNIQIFLEKSKVEK